MNIEAEAARIVATAKAEAEHFARFGRPVQQPQAVPAAQPVPPIPTIQENHMSVSVLLADAEKAAAALVKHVGVLATNPLVDTLVESGLGLVLTPGEITAVISFIKAIESERTALAAPVAAAQGVATAFQADGAQQLQQTVQGPQAPAVVRPAVV